MAEILLDVLLDSLKIFIFVFAFNFLFSFIEKKLSKNKITVPLGAAFGLIPQCGFSVVAAEKFNKKQISMGTLLAVFIATSDEALPVLFSNLEKIPAILPLLALKFAIAIAIGYLCDLIFKLRLAEEPQVAAAENEAEHKDEYSLEHKEHEHGKTCCCNGHDHEEGFVHEHVLHPLVHSLQTLIVVLIFNLVFSIIIALIGETVLTEFIKSNAYLSPLFSVIIGLIPNCASSVIIAEMFVTDKIAFGACLAGLIANAGVGLTVLFGRKNNVKNAIKVIIVLIGTALLCGYVCCLITGF